MDFVHDQSMLNSDVCCRVEKPRVKKRRGGDGGGNGGGSGVGGAWPEEAATGHVS